MYESPRDEVKQAQDELDDYMGDDYINDLEQTKDAEIEALQDRIDAWDLYLKSLEWRINEADRIQRD